jgi:RHS repeat-associated protein
VEPCVGDSEYGLLGERAEPVHGCGRQGGTFDRNGNLTGDGVWAYGYDLDNRMKTASRPGTGATLAYDPEGRLVRTTVNGVETNLLYDGQNLVGEYDGAGRLTRRYVFGPGVDAPLVQYEGAATNAKSWLYANQQGSVVALANATGATTASQGYGPFGETEGIPGSRFGYTGQQYLAALGLYYYKARMYSPGLGRFLQTDPVGTADDLNLYAYVKNNPANFTDPTGMIAASGFGSTNNAPTASVNTPVQTPTGAPKLDTPAFTTPMADKKDSTPGSDIKIAADRGSMYACDIISSECKGSVLREFPGQYLNSTLRDIQSDANSGNKDARKALKLLNDNRFKR